MKEHLHKHNEKHNEGHNEKEINTHEEGVSKIDIILYIISVILFIIGFIPLLEPYKMYIYIAVIGISGYELLINGLKGLFTFNFEEETLMTIAVISAFILGDFVESSMVVLLFALGEFLEDKAVENSNKSIRNIVEIKPQNVNILKDGDVTVVNAKKAKPGDMILIKPGEMVPLDCKIIDGESTLDTSNITGESKPQRVSGNDNLLSGEINLTGSLKCIVTKDLENSTASQIVDLVYEATNNKGKTENFITKFSKTYTPTIMVVAMIIGLLPTILFNQDILIWLRRALVFLVASCPCSIVISVPLAFFSCVGRISKKGMLIKGTKHIEDLAQAEYVAFDKTGTITTGKMQVDKLVAEGKIPVKEMVQYMYNLEKNSNHPISTAIVKEAEKKDAKISKRVDNYEEISGHGLYGKIEGKDVLFGNEKLLEKYDVTYDKLVKNAIYLVVDGEIEGYVTLKEEVREGLENLKSNMKKHGIKEVIMLTGDNEKSAEKIAQQVGITEFCAGLLPNEKLEKVREIKHKGKVIFIGDGINDSPVLAGASFGVAMGEGTEIASSVADGILISNKISTIPSVIEVARKTMKIVKFNISFSLLVKAIVLVLAVVGIAPMWLAVVADTGVSLLTVLNSIRILKV